jgi:hypothetical protein
MGFLHRKVNGFVSHGHLFLKIRRKKAAGNLFIVTNGLVCLLISVQAGGFNLANEQRC